MKILKYSMLSLLLSMLFFNVTEAKKEVPAPATEAKKPALFNSLQPRLIGPAISSGRISDFAVDPNDRSYFFVGVACGGVWKTTNAGVTFTPVFDNEKSYSIGCVVLDPNNRDVVWVGTGENNSQRSVAWGDGVYKSVNGGKSWKKMGLDKSEHIGKIIVDKNNSDIIWVAAQGPLWADGGDRGLYKSTDGGKTWEKSLYISEKTGVTDVVIDPRNSNVLYCASYQRRRHVWTVINGGPETAIYKTEDGGKTWNKLSSGLPGSEMGKIGLAISPANPDYVYATIEAADNAGGFFRSTNKGSSWEKMNSWVSGSAQYYQELICDPIDKDRVFAMDTYARYTNDGGKTFVMLSTAERHVDDHALFIDPKNTNYLMIGGDGGMYESYDRGATWRFFENLPVTQFYRVTADNSEPFYFVYGGTQDNNSLAGPAKSASAYGIKNQDWYYVVGGDGYEAQIDPTNPNIVYGQWQYGGLIRYDKKSGEQLGIKPAEEEGEELRWNWDAPVLLSPHNPQRLYFAANKLFRSDDRGNSWKRISPDLTRQINRDELPVMDKIWPPEAVAKSASTSLFGNIISISESPKKENLIYIGTDDGLIQVTENSGESWRKIDKFVGVPETTYVSDVWASRHDESRVYATFNNHKNADFKPYILVSNDKGASWKSISSNLPDDAVVWTIVEDHVDPNLLFCGTEFGAYLSTNAGEKWEKIPGLPPIAVRDLDIQTRENDLVIGTFGRGIYIIDNYAPIREFTKENLDKEATIFTIKPALLYVPDESVGQHNYGNDMYRADNPEFGATFTYYLKEAPKTKKSLRKEAFEKAEKAGEKPKYPTLSELRAEDEQSESMLLFTIRDAEGKVIRTLKTSPSEGVNKIVWDLRYPNTNPLSEKTNTNKNSGLLVCAGMYSVSMAMMVDGVTKELVPAKEFSVKSLGNTTLPADNPAEADKFRRQYLETNRKVTGAQEYFAEVRSRLNKIEQTIKASMGADPKLLEKVDSIDAKFNDLSILLSGNKSISKRNYNQTPAISDRLDNIAWGIWQSTSNIPETHKQSLKVVEGQIARFSSALDAIVNGDLKELENELDKIGAPWTPGRKP